MGFIGDGDVLSGKKNTGFLKIWAVQEQCWMQQ
jgi:hypothetical protein